MDEMLQRFIEKAPVAVMARAAMVRVLSDSTLDALFERMADRQYTRELTFSTVVRLMTQVVLGTHDSVHAAYRHTKQVPVSITAVYAKLGGLEPAISEALVQETGQAFGDIIAAVKGRQPDAVRGLRVRILDGNFLAGTEHRLKCLRGSGAAALPGMSLVVRDGRTGLLTDLLACEDAYTNERSLFARVLERVQADDLWLADRNFCTFDYLNGFAGREAFFLVRHHAGAALESLGERESVGSNDSGDLFEEPVRLGSLTCRCLIVRLFQPLRDGATEIRLLTNVPRQRAGARRLAELYRTRWTIETAFQELTDNLRCEVNTLGYPQAALFAFALALTAYNLLVTVQAALRSVWKTQAAESDLSSYHLATEVATVSEGLAIAVPEEAWHRLAEIPLRLFTRWLQDVARQARWERYRKNPRGPKRPTPIQRTRRGAHRSTARLLKAKKNHDFTP